MEAFVAVVLVVFVVVAGIFESPLIDILLDVRDDLNNRNDRGMLKKPSSKHVI
jgi:hypothetical protein